MMPPSPPRGIPTRYFTRFLLVRERDVSGVSGTGIVAEGVRFSNGSVALRWGGRHSSHAIYSSIKAVESIHGHKGATQVRWIDGEGE